MKLDNSIPGQQQDYPGTTGEMSPQPSDMMEGYVGSGKLQGKRAIVTGGDSGIGRAVALAFAKEGADVAIVYLSEQDDARTTVQAIEACGRRALSIQMDLGSSEACSSVVDQVTTAWGGLDILVNNAGFQHPKDAFEDITPDLLERTFRTNVFSYIWMTQAALPHLENGSCIINTSSVNGLRGNGHSVDYAASKGAVNALTYSLAQLLHERGIRVNAVAPGPVWTPLIPSTMPENKVEDFGKNTPYERPAQPDEIAPSYVFFASDSMSCYYSGEVLTPVGGETMPG